MCYLHSAQLFVFDSKKRGALLRAIFVVLRLSYSHYIQTE